MAKQHVTWLENPEKDDCGNALNYLSLIYSERNAAKLVKVLHKADMIEREAKDFCAPARCRFSRAKNRMWMMI